MILPPLNCTYPDCDCKRPTYSCDRYLVQSRSPMGQARLKYGHPIFRPRRLAVGDHVEYTRLPADYHWRYSKKRLILTRGQIVRVLDDHRTFAVSERGGLQVDVHLGDIQRIVDPENDVIGGRPDERQETA